MEDKLQKERSRAYPSVSLKLAIESTRKLKTNSGIGPYSREVVARGLGYSSVSGPAASRIAALAHFGLLSKKGGVYELTDVARRIILPLEEDDEKDAVRAAAKNPDLYYSLISDYGGKPLPKLLRNTLILGFGIKEKVVDGVLKNFTETMEFAGLLKDGVMIETKAEDFSTIFDFSGAKPISKEKREVERSDIGEVEKKISKNEDGLLTFEYPSGMVILFPREVGLDLSKGEFWNEINALEEKVKNSKTSGQNKNKNDVGE